MVGDPGIEPGMGLPGGVTVRCRTLQPVAHSECFDTLQTFLMSTANPAVAILNNRYFSDCDRVVCAD